MTVTPYIESATELYFVRNGDIEPESTPIGSKLKPNQSLWRHFGDTMSLENRSIFQLMKKGHLWHSPWVENGCCFIHQSDLVHDPPKKPLSHVLTLHNGPIFGNQARSPSSSTTLCHCCRRSYVGRVFTLHGIAKRFIIVVGNKPIGLFTVQEIAA